MIYYFVKISDKIRALFESQYQKHKINAIQYNYMQRYEKWA
ncbi:hypothetical protein [Helicobacter sp. T3_23-1059]